MKKIKIPNSSRRIRDFSLFIDWFGSLVRFFRINK
jgi:hypothetical protein